MGKHLGAISSTCYLESGSWNRVGRNKADSVLSLINDCWDQGAGAGLARRYRGVTSGQECAAGLWGFCCAGLRESPAPCCCFSMLFPFPSLALGRVVWQRILFQRAGGMVVLSSCLWRRLVQSRHSLGGVFLPLVGCLLLDHQLRALGDLLLNPADLLRAVLEPLDCISSWSIRAQLMAVPEPWAPVSGWSSGAGLIESQDPIPGWSPSALLTAEPWSPGTPSSPSLSRLGPRGVRQARAKRPAW